MYFHTDNERDINWLAAVLDQAALNQRKVRLDVQDGALKVKIGEGPWTAPIHGTPDPYRDLSGRPQVPRNCSNCGAVLVNEDCPNYGSGPEHAFTFGKTSEVFRA